MKQFALVLFFSSFVTGVFSCGFHMPPPFGANWYHQQFFDLQQFSGERGCFGIMYYQQEYRKTFLIEEKIQALKGRQQLSTFYYHFIPHPRLGITVSVTKDEISTDALDESGKILNIKSKSYSQAGINCNFLLRKINSGQLNFEAYMNGAFTINPKSNDIIISEIGWLKHEWEKISPRIIAGSNTMNGSAGCTGLLGINNNKLQTSVSYRMHREEAIGYHRGNEINFSIKYWRNFKIGKTGLNPFAGMILVNASADWQETNGTKLQDVMASGNYLFMSTGMSVSLGNELNLTFSYYQPLLQNIYNQYQLFNKSAFQAGIQFTM